jgi:uncharacterized membrane protein
VTQPSSSAPSSSALSAAYPFRFRQRGTQTSRLEAFSDAVFALTLTLLVVSTEVPKTFDQLMAKLGVFFPFALCFVLFITIWLQHYFFFRRYGLTDLGTIFINSALLLVVLFFVYPLKFLFTASSSDLTFEQVRTLFVLYGVGFAAIYVLFALFYANALRHRAALDLNRVEVFDTRNAIWANLGVAAVGIGSILLAQFPQTIGAAGYFYFAILFTRWGQGILTGRRRRALVAAEQKREAGELGERSAAAAR